MRCDRKRAAVMVSLVASTFEGTMLAISGKNKLNGQLNGSLMPKRWRSSSKDDQDEMPDHHGCSGDNRGLSCLRDRHNKYLL